MSTTIDNENKQTGLQDIELSQQQSDNTVVEVGGSSVSDEHLIKIIREYQCKLGVAVALGFIGIILAVVLPIIFAYIHPTSLVLSSYGNADAPEGFTFAGSVFKGAGQWIDRPDMPFPLSDFVAVTGKTSEGYEKVFLIGGNDVNGSMTNYVQVYDPMYRTYEFLEPLPIARMRFGASYHDSRIYVVGGFLDGNWDTATDVVHVYDILTDTWETGPSTAVKHADTCVATVESVVYVVGGYDTEDYYASLSSVEALDLSRSDPVWTSVADLPTPRGDINCASVGNHLAVLGGWNADWTAPLSTFEVYNPATDTWITKRDMPNPRADAGVAVLSGARLLIISGEIVQRGVTQVPRHEVDMYTFHDDVWTEVAPIPTARFRFAAAAVDDIIYAFGGHDLCTTVMNSAWTSTVSNDCYDKALSSTQAYLTTSHSPLYYYYRDGASENFDDFV